MYYDNVATCTSQNYTELSDGRCLVGLVELWRFLWARGLTEVGYCVVAFFNFVSETESGGKV